MIYAKKRENYADEFLEFETCADAQAFVRKFLRVLVSPSDFQEILSDGAIIEYKRPTSRGNSRSITLSKDNRFS